MKKSRQELLLWLFKKFGNEEVFRFQDIIHSYPYLAKSATKNALYDLRGRWIKDANVPSYAVGIEKISTWGKLNLSPLDILTFRS